MEASEHARVAIYVQAGCVPEMQDLVQKWNLRTCKRRDTPAPSSWSQALGEDDPTPPYGSIALQPSTVSRPSSLWDATKLVEVDSHEISYRR